MENHFLNLLKSPFWEGWIFAIFLICFVFTSLREVFETPGSRVVGDLLVTKLIFLTKCTYLLSCNECKKVLETIRVTTTQQTTDNIWEKYDHHERDNAMVKCKGERGVGCGCCWGSWHPRWGGRPHLAEGDKKIRQRLDGKGERFSMSFCKDFDYCLYCKSGTIMRMSKVIASRQENKTSMCVDVLKKRSYRVSQKKNAFSEPRQLPVLLSPQLWKHWKQSRFWKCVFLGHPVTLPANFIAQLIISTEGVLGIRMTYDNYPIRYNPIWHNPIPTYSIEGDLSLSIYLCRPTMT